MTATQEARLKLLETTAADVGQRLFVNCRTEILREGRTVSGGWPGTVREARGLVRTVLVPALAERRLPAPTESELDQVMRAAYGEARRGGPG